MIQLPGGLCSCRYSEQAVPRVVGNGDLAAWSHLVWDAEIRWALVNTEWQNSLTSQATIMF